MKKIILATTILMCSSQAYSIDLGSMLKDQAVDSVKDQAVGSMKDQAVDKAVDMGSDYTKSSIKSYASTPGTATPSATNMALKAASESSMTDSAIDTGADYGKSAVKGMIK